MDAFRLRAIEAVRGLAVQCLGMLQALFGGDTRMTKIQMTTPLVEMDGDEMTRII